MAMLQMESQSLDPAKGRSPYATSEGSELSIGVPSDMPGITHAEIVRGIADGGYIRGVMLEAQDPTMRAPQYAVYVLGTWQIGYAVFHVAHPARPRLFRDLDRLVEMLRFEFGFRGPISLRLAGEKVAQKSARLRARKDELAGGSSNA